METVNNLLSLVPSQHKGKPKFSAVLAALLTPLVEITNTVNTFPASFDLDTAVGKQLDATAERIQFPRTVGVTLSGYYFSWDAEGVGWDEGHWRGPFDSELVPQVLDDETYRTLLKAKAGANHWDGSLGRLQEILDQVFEGSGTSVFALDYQDMSMEFVVSGTIPSELLRRLLVDGYFPLKPGGVRIRGYRITSLDGAPVFAFDAPTGPYVAGWDIGAWASDL